MGVIIFYKRPADVTAISKYVRGASTKHQQAVQDSISIWMLSTALLVCNGSAKRTSISKS